MIEIGRRDQVFILTGAGISAESGIPTFRGINGLWKGYRVEEVACPEAWARDPRLVWEFYSMRRRHALTCTPNPGHRALARLEDQLGDRLFLCTQNVDSLHEQAGSRRVHHMHGYLFKSRCDRCGRQPFDDTQVYDATAKLPRCECGGGIRPHICWFGEMPFDMDRIFEQLAETTLFMAIGTSGVVEPAASLAAFARRSGKCKRVIYVGPEEPANQSFFTESHLGEAGKVLPELFTVET